MKIGVYILSIAAFFLAACGSDSGTDSNSGDSVARVETIYDLGECETLNEGVVKRVDSEERIYTCRRGVWQPEEEKVSSGNNGGSSQKSEIHSSSTISKGSGNLSSSSFVEIASSSSFAEVKYSSSFVGSSESSTQCEGSVYDAASKTLKDCRDDRVYRTTQIGLQVWMAENLSYRYLGPTADEDSSSFCYADDPYNCRSYGRLYLWSAAMDSAGLYGEKGKGCGYGKVCSRSSGSVQGVCPKGWHLPDSTEWRTLVNMFVSLHNDGEVDTLGFDDVALRSYRMDGGYGKDGYDHFWTADEDDTLEVAYPSYSHPPPWRCGLPQPWSA